MSKLSSSFLVLILNLNDLNLPIRVYLGGLPGLGVSLWQNVFFFLMFWLYVVYRHFRFKGTNSLEAKRWEKYIMQIAT